MSLANIIERRVEKIVSLNILVQHKKREKKRGSEDWK